MAFHVFGLVLWGFVAVFGAWLLVTARPLPASDLQGWKLRVFGLFLTVAGAFFAYRAFQGWFSPEGIVFSYVAFGLVVWTAWRKSRTAGSAGPQI
jgi:heme O synthase-like polyprenyltransferase